MIWVLIVFLIFISICLYCFIVCFYTGKKRPTEPYGLISRSPYKAVEDKIFASIRLMEQAPFEEVSIRSYDGLTLHGKYYHHKDGAPVEIIFHGYRSMSLLDCSGGYAYAKKNGINLLAVDQRAHGKSGSNVITYGIKERYDCLSWAEYAAERFGKDTPIILSGLSMGAATVVMATQLPLPERVCCVIADCPYSVPSKIIRKVSNDLHVPSALSYPFIWIGARILGGISLNAASPLDAAKVSKIPILLIHGEDDHLIPCDMSRQIHEQSNGCTTFETFPDADHGLCYIVNPKRYERICTDFLTSIPSLRQYMLSVQISQFEQNFSLDI